MDPKVMETIRPYFSEKFGNSISSLHAYGWEAERAVEDARKEVSDTIGATPHEIFFTSGATESNNWVLQGLTSRLRRESALENKKIHIISSAIEHNSILKTLEHLKACDLITYDLAPVNSSGTVELESIKSLILPETKLISIMWVSNEIGSVNPIKEIGNLARESKIYFHTDATQAIGKLPVNLAEMPIDLMSFSGHKIYAPKGVGALFIRARQPKVQIDPLLFGGGHERAYRAGTLNVPSIVGLGQAMKLIKSEGGVEIKRMWDLKIKYLNIWWQAKLPFTLNGGNYSNQSPHILSVTFNQNEIEPLNLQGVAYSRGSACQSGETSMSHVLQALKFSQEQANHTLRLSFGRFTTDKDFLKLTKILFEKFKINYDF